MTHRTARVVAVHPKLRTVDLVMNDTGQRIAGVQVASRSSSDTGSWDVPSVSKPLSEAAPDALDPNGRNLIALVGYVGGRAFVSGFIHPQGTQMAFTEDDREVHRHASGAYTTTAPDGSMEHFHPGGAYVRIGTGEHQDLADVSADGNWTLPAGVPAPQITVVTAGFKLTVAPNGATTLVTTGELHMTYSKAFLTGDVALDGALHATGDVVAGTVSLQQHRNTEVQPGNGISGIPVQ